jgi:hypothetical protein
MSRLQPSRLALLVAVLSGAYILGIAFNLTPWLRGPEEWRWAYVIPGSFQRLWLPVLLTGGYCLFLIWWFRQPSQPGRTAEYLFIASFMTAAIQLGLLYLEHADVRSQLFYRTVSELSGGFYNVGAVVTDNAAFLASFGERMASFPIHPQRHPPGLPLLFAWTRQLFDHFPELAAQVSAQWRPYQCHNYVLMNLPNSVIASASLQMLLPFALGLVTWPLYHFGRLVYDRETGLRAALLWPLLPGVAMWATQWNQLYALFTLPAFILLHLGLARRWRLGFLLTGLVLHLATWFTFANLIIAAFLGLYALLWYWTCRERPTFAWMASGAGLLFAGLFIPWLIAGAAFNFDPLAIWQQGLGTHLSLDRSYLTWLFYHLYDFFVFLGIPLFVLWAAGTASAFRQWGQGKLDILAISALAGLLILNFSGTSRGEVARVWAFLFPLFLLVAARYLSNRASLAQVAVAFLGMQLVVGNIYLRTIDTGLTDPPAPPPAASHAPPLAAWEGGPILQAVDLPPAADPGQTISVDATWSTAAQMQRPYSIFVHLLDGASNLVAQDDGLPLDGNWLTTCWQPGQSFADSYSLDIPPGTGPGLYELRMGFYWLPTGERLALMEPDGGVADSVSIGSVEVR